MEREELHQSEQRVAALASEDDRIQAELTLVQGRSPAVEEAGIHIAWPVVTEDQIDILGRDLLGNTVIPSTMGASR